MIEQMSETCEDVRGRVQKLKKQVLEDNKKV